VWELERRAVLDDGSLSEAERALRLEALEGGLVESEQRVLRQRAARAQARREVAALQTRGASAAELFAVRERALGREAAERLAELDAVRAQWAQRWERYRTARDALLENEFVANAELGPQLDALRLAHFLEAELPRARFRDAAELQGKAAAITED